MKAKRGRPNTRDAHALRRSLSRGPDLLYALAVIIFWREKVTSIPGEAAPFLSRFQIPFG